MTSSWYARGGFHNGLIMFLRTTPSYAPLGAILLASVLFPGHALFAQPSRIRGAVDNTRRFPLTGQVRPQASPENDRGKLDPQTPISNVTLAFEPAAEQTAALNELLE